MGTMTDDIKAHLAASAAAPKRRRPHSDAFKRQVLAACAVPGASVAAVALAHGLNANLVQTWRRWARARATRSVAASVPIAPARPAANTAVAEPPFIPLALPALPAAATAAPVAASDIRIEVKRGAASISVLWPTSAASDCAAWLRELLR